VFSLECFCFRILHLQNLIYDLFYLCGYKNFVCPTKEDSKHGVFHNGILRRMFRPW